MKQKLLALACAALLLLGGCAPQEKTAPEGAVNVYFLSYVRGGNTLKSEPRACPAGLGAAGEEPAIAVIELLLAGPLDEKLISPFPAGVQLLGAARSDTGMLQLDFSEQYGQLSGVALTLANYALVLTLCQLEGVEALGITVDGEALPYLSREILRESDVILSSGEGAPISLSAEVYFAQEDGTLLLQMQEISMAENDTALAAVLAALMSGPVDGAEYLPLPQGTELLSVSLEGDICYANFSAPFWESRPKRDAQCAAILYSVVDTLCAQSGVRAVHLLLEGESIEAYGGIPTLSPLEASSAAAE